MLSAGYWQVCLDNQKMLEKPHRTHLPKRSEGVHALCLLLGFENQTIVSDFITIFGCKLNQCWVSGITFVCNMCSEGTSI